MIFLVELSREIFGTVRAFPLALQSAVRKPKKHVAYSPKMLCLRCEYAASPLIMVQKKQATFSPFIQHFPPKKMLRAHFENDAHILEILQEEQTTLSPNMLDIHPKNASSKREYAASPLNMVQG